MRSFAETAVPNPFIDPQGYKAEINLVEQTVRSVFDDQKKALHSRR